MVSAVADYARVRQRQATVLAQIADPKTRADLASALGEIAPDSSEPPPQRAGFVMQGQGIPKPAPSPHTSARQEKA